MRWLLLFLLLSLLLFGLNVSAASYNKCAMPDGSIRYQEAPCPGASKGSVSVSRPPPAPPPVTRQMVQAFDPQTGMPADSYVDAPAPPTSGPMRVERRMVTVYDPATGQPRESWVDVTVPIDVPRSTPTPATDRTLPRTRSTQTQEWMSDDSTYQAAKCRVAPNHPDCR